MSRATAQLVLMEIRYSTAFRRVATLPKFAESPAHFALEQCSQLILETSLVGLYISASQSTASMPAWLASLLHRLAFAAFLSIKSCLDTDPTLVPLIDYSSRRLMTFMDEDVKPFRPDVAARGTAMVKALEKNAFVPLYARGMSEK
jgi:hypothetical protein